MHSRTSNNHPSPMETTSSSSSRFRFRDHNKEMADEESSDGDTTAEYSSVSSNEEEEPELQSMTARGVQHLCSELLELKQESDEDFQKNIFSNYSAFLAILKEIEVLQSELWGLKKQASLQMRLVKDVSDGIYLRVLSEETTESMLEETMPQTLSPSILEKHMTDVSETLDTLLSEHRLDDALSLLEMDIEFVQKLESGEYSSDLIMLYNSTMSDKRAILADQLTFVAKHPRVSAPELQKALIGLCQLGENQLSNELIFQYYHKRIESGVHDLQSSKGFLDVLYIHEVAKLICAMISQGVRSFIALNGETYPYASELTKWATQEIEAFSVCFSKFIESISDISGRLSTAVDALKIAMSYCSLLEARRVFLQPSLIEYTRPCIEEVLRLHIDHLINVITIVTSTDTWVLGRYYSSGLLTGGNYTTVDQQPEYLFLTDSGRKFVTLLQSVVEDVSPLIAFHMEGSALKGIMDLFTAYIVLLESALTGDTNVPEVPSQGILILANLSTLMQFSSSFIRSIFDDIHQLDFEIDNYIMFVEDVYSRLKTCFLDQFISNIFSPNINHESGREARASSENDSRICDLIPYIPYLELYLELKKLEKLAEEDCLDKNWLICLLREVIDATFEWISSKFEIWAISEEKLADNRTKFMQFILDTQFLVEIARRGEYLSENAINISNNIVSRFQNAFISAGLSPVRDLDDDEWPVSGAVVTLEKLQQVHAEESVENESAADRVAQVESYVMFENDAVVEPVRGPAIGNSSGYVTDANP